MHLTVSKINQSKISQIVFLASVTFSVFLIPLFPAEMESKMYSISISIMFFSGMLSLESRKKVILWIVIGAFITRWISEYFHLIYLEEISSSATILFFMLMVVLFVVQIARSKEVDIGVIIQAVNGYLLLGMMFAVLISITHHNFPEAYNFDAIGNFTTSDYTYFSFVTLSTLGYGDISPQMPLSKALAMLETIIGQFYLTVIVALLVGKLISNQPVTKPR